MRTPRRTLCLLALLWPAAVSAQPQPTAATQWESPRIDPFAYVLLSHRARFGETLPTYEPSVRLVRDGTLPVVVRFVTTPDQSSLAALESHGVRWHTPGVALASGAYGARVDEAALSALASDPRVAHVALDLPLRTQLPLDASLAETRTSAARRALLRADHTELDGHGTVIADIDTGVFVFHPSFFRPDAGVFPWVDVNADGLFTLDTDGVDLDRDGTIAPQEVLHLARAYQFSRFGSPVEPPVTALRPGLDWLYLDTNGNGHRDADATFSEDTPGYGEPIFQAEDADRDGRLSLAERLWRLGTHRVRAVYSDRDYVRGDPSTGLSQFDLTGVADAPARLGHGTGVAGILISGTPYFSDRFGLATGAELITLEHRAFTDRTGTTGAIQRAIDAGANVILTEFAPYAGVTLDGASETEALLDAAVGQNIVTVSPAGNLATSAKHQRLTLTPGVNHVEVRTDMAFTGARTLVFSMHHGGAARAVTVHLTGPDGLDATLPDTAPRGTSLPGGLVGYIVTRTTARGTRERHITLATPRGTLAVGGYAFDITLSAGAPLDADLYVADNVNSWARGATFTRSDPTRTLCHPSTSDLTITVGAYTLHGDITYAPSSREGDLAAYSSVGPRFDGAPGIDLAAPDNPMSTMAPTAMNAQTTAYVPFGGTSGAGPHVAAAAALLRQRYPDETAMELRARLLDHARRDSFVTSVAARWGAGKLDLLAALDQQDTIGGPLALRLRCPERVRTGRAIVCVLEVTDDRPLVAVRVRWDDDYDGRPDSEWVPLAARSIATDHDGVYAIRVEAHDSDGFVRAAVARVEAVRDLPDPPADAGIPDASVAPPPTPGGCSCDASKSASPRGVVGCGAVAMIPLAARRRKARTRR